MIDVTADIVIPGSTRSSWKPLEGQWMLRRALNATERSIVTGRANDLAHALAPLSNEEKPKAFALIATMLNGWRQLRTLDGEEAELTVKIIVAAVADAPLWAIDIACQRFRTGRVEQIVPEFNNNYPPNDIHIVKVVEYILNTCKRREREARDLLSAPVEPPPPPSQPKTECHNLIKYSDVPEGVVPNKPQKGSHMARVLADIEARKRGDEKRVPAGERGTLIDRSKFGDGREVVDALDHTPSGNDGCAK